MSEIIQLIDDRLKAFIEAQHVFFVGTAPVGKSGHVNISPKGMESFRVLGPQTVAYLDYVGSGVETIAHVRENQRIVIMFCSFEGPPKILRLHGQGEVIEPQDEDFKPLSKRFTSSTGVRAILRIHVERVRDSCGYGVPKYKYEGQRGQLDAWANHKGENELRKYQGEKNARSIDGLPALRWVTDSDGSR